MDKPSLGRSMTNRLSLNHVIRKSSFRTIFRKLCTLITRENNFEENFTPVFRFGSFVTSSESLSSERSLRSNNFPPLSLSLCCPEVYVLTRHRNAHVRYRMNRYPIFFFRPIRDESTFRPNLLISVQIHRAIIYRDWMSTKRLKPFTLSSQSRRFNLHERDTDLPVSF